MWQRLAAIALALASTACLDPMSPLYWPMSPSSPVTTVRVSPSSDTLSVGAKLQLSVTLHDAAGSEVFGRTVTWSSSEPGTASVSALGRVTAVAPGGPVTITARCDGATGTATVVVGAMVIEVGRGSGTIDGVLDDVEWAGATRVPYDVMHADSVVTAGTAYLMHDGTNIYVAVRLARRDPTAGEGLTVGFDSDRNGTMSDGDDWVQLASGNFYDQWNHWNGTTHVGQVDDLSMPGGRSDGAGVTGVAGGMVTMEVRHPLASGDPYDVRLTPGDTIHFALGTSIHWPGRQTVSSYISHIWPSPPQPVLVIRP